MEQTETILDVQQIENGVTNSQLQTAESLSRRKSHIFYFLSLKCFFVFFS